MREREREGGEGGETQLFRDSLVIIIKDKIPVIISMTSHLNSFLCRLMR